MLAYPVNVWLVKNGLKHGMGTERALGKGGAKVGVEQSRLATSAPSEPVAPAGRAQNAPEPVHEMNTMPGMSGVRSAVMSSHVHTPDSHRATEDAPANDMSGMEMLGMKMQERGKTVSIGSKLVVALATIAMLAGGVVLAARYGDLSMRAGERKMNEPMEMPVGHDGMTK